VRGERSEPPPRGSVVRPLRATNQRRFSGRLRVTYLVVVALVLALGVRLAFIQIASGAYYAKASVQQVSTTVTIPSLRGAIYDRNGNVLAISAPTSLVVADDFQVTDATVLAAALSPYLSIKVSVLAKELARRSGYVVLDPDLSVATGHTLAAQEFPGIAVLSSSVRTTPNGTLAQSLLGGINASGVGSAGLEYQYQSILAGQTGTEQLLESSGINLPGTRVTVLKKAVPGLGLELTIDAPLQYVAEQDLARQLKDTGALSGVALVMDVKSGQILADASLVNTATSAGALGPIPSWGVSTGVAGIDQTVNNLAFSSVYEPGSVFKIVPFSAALDAGIITPTSKFTVPYSVVVDGRTFHDADFHATETLSATNIIAQSSNIGTIEISRHVGEARLLAQVERLGFGQVTDLNYPGETPGLLINANNWNGSDLGALPIGQVDAVPPIQVLDGYNAIANGGVFVEPQLERGFVSSSGALTPTATTPSHRALSAPVAAELTKMLEQVVLAGTGVEAEIPGYQIAGKTGTSQIPTPGQQSYLAGDYDASFVGFAPANHPVLSMLVMIQRPESTIYGGSIAAPVFQEVMSYALHHYGVPATGPTKVIKRSAASIDSDVT
jgi:cell division protein FtsI (penicillin-binding protein 3)